MTPKKQKPGRLLTEVELELMRQVWSLGECTVKEVQQNLHSDRELAYTTVATVMKILEQKRFLVSKKLEKAHTFRPLVSREEYANTTLRHISDQVFQGDPGSMVMRLLGDSRISGDELIRIRRLLDEKMGEK